MALQRHHHHHRHRYHNHLSTVTAFTFLLFFSAYATALSQLGSGGRVLEDGGEERENRGNGIRELERVLSRRRLGGPGSSPPTCRSKCGKCSPCKPVHVPIQPGLSMPLEYYPEAWRCKCGNKLFMP